MSWIDIWFLAVALAIDACVVSFTYGLVFKENRVKNSLTLAVFVGFFQFLMPVIGYFASNSVSVWLEPISKWLVFGIFLLLGLKFIIEALQVEEKELCCISVRCLFAIAFATSIDALVAGVSLYFSGAKVLFPSILIGVVTFVLSLVGFWSGNFFKRFPSKSLEILGGLILILLAFKSL